MKQLLSLLTLLLLCLSGFCLLHPTVLFAQKTDQSLDKLIQRHQQEIQRLTGERRDTVERIEQYRLREERVLDVFKVLNGHIKVSEARLARIVEQIDTARERIRLTGDSIRRLQRQIDEDRQNIDRQLRALFYVGKAREMTLFIGLNTFENYFRNRRLLERSTRLDLVVLDRFLDNLARLKTERTQLEDQRRRLVALQQAEEEQKSLLDFERRQQTAYLQHLRDDRSARLKYLREIQMELERVNDHLYSLETRLESQTRAAAFEGFRGQRNRLLAPVVGRLVHRFGQEQSPFFTLFRQGVLVETEPEAVVSSVLAGRVVWSGAFRGYQNLVILDHGKGSYSVYGNLDEVFVLVDEVVESGASLGTVAWDQLEERSLFYFETRYNRRAVNPLQWLDKPKW
jgi:murein hydrolase activator